MVLTNLAQVAMTATDVMMIGPPRAPTALAAGALGSNLYFAPLIFGLGLMLATSPMIGDELGRRRHSVRDIRRTVRQGLWIAILVVVPIWILLWNSESILLAMGQEPELARQAGIYVHWLQWAILPFYFYIVLRSFISALERPGWALVIMFVAVAFNAFGNWLLIFGNLGFPAMGIAGSGLATTLSSVLMFAGLAAVVVSVERQFRRYRVFGRFWRADWPRFMALLRLGAPIAGILAFEVTIFNAAASLDGADRCRLARRPCDRHPDCLRGLHGAARIEPGGHGARRARLRRRQPGGHRPRRLDGLRPRRRLHALIASTMLLWPRLLIAPSSTFRIPPTRR